MIHLPLYVKLTLVPIALWSAYTIQPRWFLISLGSMLLVAWKHIQTPLKFAYSCFLKPLGDHGNQQSRLESFYEDQAKSNEIFMIVEIFFFFFKKKLLNSL